MAVPKQRMSKSKTRMRRSHNDRVSLPKLVPCPNCGEYMRPHHVCSNCGYYKGEEIVNKEED